MRLYHEGEDITDLGFNEIDEEAEMRPVEPCPECGCSRLERDDPCDVCEWEPDRLALLMEKQQAVDEQVFDAMEEMVGEYNN